MTLRYANKCSKFSAARVVASISCNDQWNNSLSVSHLTHLGGQMELRYIGDYCDHFTIIVLSLAKNDPPNSDLKKMEQA